MDLKYVLYEVKDAVAVIAINSPKTLNAINDNIIEELYQCFAAAEADPAVRATVLTGTGKAFCAGGELGSFKTGLEDGTLDMAANMRNSSRLTIAMRTSAKPVIAAVRGSAAGAGCSLALCSDFCFAADNAKFIEAFIGVGLLADTGGLYALARAVGDIRALQLCMTGEPISAEKALEYGIVYRVVPEAELEEQVMKFAARLAKGPSSCYRALKRMAWETAWKGYGDYMALEQELQSQCAASPNFREGVFAFLEKRKPDFT